MTACVG